MLPDTASTFGIDHRLCFRESSCQCGTLCLRVCDSCVHVFPVSPTSPQAIVRLPFIVSPWSDVSIRVSRDQTNARSVVVPTLLPVLNDRTAAYPGRAGIYDACATNFYTYCDWYGSFLLIAQQYLLLDPYGWFKSASTSPTKKLRFHVAFLSRSQNEEGSALGQSCARNAFSASGTDRLDCVDIHCYAGRGISFACISYCLAIESPRCSDVVSLLCQL